MTHVVSSPAHRAVSLRRQQWLLGVLGAVLVTVVWAIGLLDRLELPTLDWRARTFDRWAPARSDDVVIVGIDDDAVRTIQRWPWHRSYLAEAVRELTRAGARTIAIDLLLDDPQEARGTIEDDAELAAAIREHGNVVLAANFRAGAAGGGLTSSGAGASGDSAGISLSAVLGLIDADPALLQLSDDAGTREVLRSLYPAEAAAHGPLREEARRAFGVARTLVLAMPRDSVALPEAAARWLGCDEPVPPFQAFAQSASALGDVSSATTDADGVLRRMPLWVEFRDRLWPSLALGAALAHASRDHRTSIGVHDSRFTSITIDDGTRLEIPMTAARVAGRAVDGLLLVSWPRGGLGWLGASPGQDAAHDLPIGFVLEPMLIGRTIRANLAEIDGLVMHSGETDRPELSGYAERANELQALPIDAPGWSRLMEDHRRAAIAVAAAAREFLDFAGEPEPATLSESDAAALANYQAIARGIPALLEECDAGLARIAAARQLIRDRVSGKLCLIGWAATSSAVIADTVATSLRQQTPGVYIHAAVASAILTRYWRTPLPPAAAAAAVLTMGLAGTLIGIRARVTLGPLIVGAAIGGWFLVSGAVLWDALRLVAPVAAPAVAVASSWLLVILHRYLIVDRARRRTEQRFRSYVSPDVVDILVANPQLDSMAPQRRQLTVMFSDLAGFTPIAEELGPDRTASFLTRYFAAMTDRLQAHGATIDKYLGDGIMAFWGAPLDDSHHAAHACLTALEMHAALDRLNRDSAAGPIAIPALRMRIGLAAGELLVGDFGNPPRHSSYTVLGDTSNLAARLESACRHLGCATLASSRVRELAGEAFLWRPIGRVLVQGRSRPEPAFELLAEIQRASSEQVDRAALTSRAIGAFAVRDFASSITHFRTLSDHFPDAALAAAYLAEIGKWEDGSKSGSPSAGFEGTLPLTDK